VGVAELVFATRAGAIFGFLLIWVPIVSLFFKYFITELVGRYTIVTGEDVIAAFGRIETKLGPVTLPKGWVLWLFWAFFIASVAGMSGIALTVGSALFAIYSGVPYVAWSIIALTLVGVILFAGSYRGLEYTSRLLMIVIVCFIFYAVLRRFPPLSDMAAGLVPNVPEESLRELIPLLGWSGAGAMGTIWFSLWTKASGRGASRVIDNPSAGEVGAIRGWISTNRVDLVVNMILTVVLTVGFIIAGAMILNPLGIVPEGEGLGVALAKIAGDFYGPGAVTIFLVGVVGTLYSTLLADTDGLCRVAGGAVKAQSKTKRPERFFYMVFLVVYVVCAGLFTTVIPAPVVLLQVTAVIDTILLPIVGLMAIHICTKTLPIEFRPKRVTVVMSYLSILFFVFFIVLLVAAVVVGVDFSM
jgi:Mn2+/Fe2+ NRAMP family transporter